MSSIKTKIIFNRESFEFDLKLLSIAEERSLIKRDSETAKAENAEKSFADAVNSLAEFSMSDVKITSLNEQGEEVKSETTVRKFFADHTAKAERVALFAYHGWLEAMRPNVMTTYGNE